MAVKITYRRAVAADIPLLARHHRLMFEEMRAAESENEPKDNCCSGPDCCVTLPSFMESSTPVVPVFKQLEAAQKVKLEQQLPDGSCVAWIAEYQGEPVASGAVSIIQTTPVPEDLSFEVGFLHSVYTRQSMRGRGIASGILDHLLTHCRQKGLHRVQLNTSEAGSGIYRTKGFCRLENAMIVWL